MISFESELRIFKSERDAAREESAKLTAALERVWKLAANRRKVRVSPLGVELLAKEEAAK